MTKVAEEGEEEVLLNTAFHTPAFPAIISDYLFPAKFRTAVLVALITSLDARKNQSECQE